MALAFISCTPTIVLGTSYCILESLFLNVMEWVFHNALGGTGCNNGGAGYNSLWLFLDWKKDDCHKNFVANSLGFGNVYSNAYDWVLSSYVFGGLFCLPSSGWAFLHPHLISLLHFFSLFHSLERSIIVFDVETLMDVVFVAFSWVWCGGVED